MHPYIDLGKMIRRRRAVQYGTRTVPPGRLILVLYGTRSPAPILVPYSRAPAGPDGPASDRAGVFANPVVPHQTLTTFYTRPGHDLRLELGRLEFGDRVGLDRSNIATTGSSQARGGRSGCGLDAEPWRAPAIIQPRGPYS